MIYGYEDSLTMLLMIIGIGLSLYAQFKISGTYGKFKKVLNKSNISGCEVARKILDENGLQGIYVVETKGNLTDHYDPSRKVIRLSTDIFHGNSIAAISVAAHECGHAIQDKENYAPMRIRSMIIPIVNFISYAGYFVMILSLIFGMIGYFMTGIIMLLATLVFQVITLPVEFDASKRAEEELVKLKIVDSNESTSVKGMLNAAAFTYIASVISTLLSILRLIIMANRDRD